jgi:hypothetical protein
MFHDYRPTDASPSHSSTRAARVQKRNSSMHTHPSRIGADLRNEDQPKEEQPQR